MKSFNHDDAFTGLEAAIVLIAFVVVAAVFSYVVLGAGFFTTQKSQETVYKGVEQATSNIQVLGSVYGMANEPLAGVDSVNFTIGIAPGAPSVDLEKMTIVVTNETRGPVVYTHGTSTTGYTADNHNFYTVNNAGAEVLNMQAQDQVQVNLTLPVISPKNTIELRPAVGAALPFERSIPPTVKSVQVLY
jgi:flagellin FlaB